MHNILLLSLTAYCSLFAAMLVLFSLQSKASSSSSFSLSQMSSSVQHDTNTRKLSRQRRRHDERSCGNRNQILVLSFGPLHTHLSSPDKMFPSTFQYLTLEADENCVCDTGRCHEFAYLCHLQTLCTLPFVTG